MDVQSTTAAFTLLLAAALATTATGFHQAPLPQWNTASLTGTRRLGTRALFLPPPLLAKKKEPKSGSGGFGAIKKSSSSVSTISADKTSLEKQWDVFTSITDLEIVPKGDPDDEDYQYFQVVDVFVRCGSTPWYRIGKVCATEESNLAAALTLQKGLIFWTAVHMRRELVAAGGTSGAASLELGFSPATMNTGSESDLALDEEDAEQVQIATRAKDVKGVQQKASFGFRPDWNPPGFTYKRREKAAMKKKKSKLEAIEEL